jgi:hypothetical protein
MKLITETILSKVLLVAALGVVTATAQADNPLLNLQLGYPQIQANSDNTQGATYDGSTLTINTTALNIRMVAGGASASIDSGLIKISANIDSLGTFIGGSFAITGMVSGTYPSPLLVGTVANYGIADFTLTTDRIELLLNVTGGSMAGLFPNGELGAILALENSTYSGDFSFPWTSGIVKGSIGPTPEPPSGVGTGTIGYWKTHPEAWPVNQLELGGVVYSGQVLISILKAAVKGDKSLSMAKQLIATKLNLEAVTEGSCITDVVDAADDWLANHGGVGSGQRQWDGGDLLHDDLDAYNNGLLCAPHRD